MRSTSIVVAVSTACIALATLATPGLAQRASKAKQPRVVNIGVVLDGPWRGNTLIASVIQQEINDLTGGEFDVRFPADKLLTGDWTPAGVKKAVDQLLGDPQVNIVLAMGVLATSDVGQRPRLDKPVLAPFVIDARLQGLPLKNGRSGRKNFSYLTVPWSFDRDVTAFRDITPFDEMIMLASKQGLDVVPGLSERIIASAQSVGVKVQIVPVGDSIDEALARIPANASAVYVSPLLHLPEAEWDKLVQGLIARKLPSFSQLGRVEVERGLMAGTRPDSNFKRLGRRLALSIQRIMLGDDPARFTVSLKLAEQLVINMATARKIGQWPTWSVITEAELINNERVKVERRISLASVVADAAKNNVDIAAAQATLDSGKQDIRQVRANLYPTVELSTTARAIDQDSAANSFGVQPEFLWNGSLTVSQLIYSDGVWTGLSAQKDVQRSLEYSYKTTELDTIQGTALTYLNILRAKSLERIQQNNLKLTRRNLDLARTRLEVGTANRAEVYRWESQIANDRKSVIDASAQRNNAEVALNRILGRPMEEPYVTEETSMEDPALLTSSKELFGLMRDPWIFRVFRRFMINEAIGRAPEIKQLDAAIAVQEQLRGSAKRAYYSPTVSLQGSLSQRFVRAGEASDPMADIPGTTWSVAVVASLPLFAGGSRPAEVAKAEAELRRLQAQRRGVRNLVAQRIGSAMHTMGASYAGIRLSRQSAEAATKNLEIITEAYGQGGLSILQLIDAQNAALVAQQVAANAVYDFLVDWMNVQRAVGQFDMMMDDAARADFFRRAQAYAAEARKENNQ